MDTVTHDPSPGRPPRRLPTIAVVLAAALLVAGTGGAAAWGLQSSGEVARQAALLDGSRAELETTRAELAAAQADLEDVRGRRAEADVEVADLRSRVARQTACVSAQRRDGEELARITDLEIDTFNLTAEDSAWAAAAAARVKAIDAAATAYGRAIVAIAEGRRAAARVAYEDARGRLREAERQEKRQLAELEKVAANSAEIDQALDRLKDRLAATRETCGIED